MKSSDNMRMALVHAEFSMQLALMIASQLMEEMRKLRPDFEQWLPDFEKHISTCFMVEPDPDGHSKELERLGQRRITEFLKRIREDLGLS
jgi:hypothetical protein